MNDEQIYEAFCQEFPGIAQSLNDRANSWEYVPVAMIDMPDDEKRKLQKTIGQWGELDNGADLLGRYAGVKLQPESNWRSGLQWPKWRSGRR